MSSPSPRDRPLAESKVRRNALGPTSKRTLVTLGLEDGAGSDDGGGGGRCSDRGGAVETSSPHVEGAEPEGAEPEGAGEGGDGGSARWRGVGVGGAGAGRGPCLMDADGGSSPTRA